jgi:hypothetical protein
MQRALTRVLAALGLYLLVTRSRTRGLCVALRFLAQHYCVDTIDRKQPLIQNVCGLALLLGGLCTVVVVVVVRIQVLVS